MRFDYNKIKNNINDIRLTTHFKLSEFINREYDYDEIILDDELLKKIEALRQLIGRPVNITANGGFRCSLQNERTEGALNSYHLVGKAVDLYVKNLSPLVVGVAGALVGFKGVIIYDSFTHLDVREELYINIKNQNGGILCN